jgi:hypothetical protein
MDFDPRTLMGSERGRPAWVLASGPSLLDVNPADLAGAVILGVNDAVRLHKERGFPKLDHWFGLDIETFERLDIRDHPGVRVWTDIQCGCFLRGRGLRQGRDYETFLISCRPELTPTNGTLSTRHSSVAPAINLAWLLGCDPIHVRGLDLKNDAEGRTHWWDAPGTGKPNAAGTYDHQAEHLHDLIQTVRESGVVITVQAASWLVEKPHVPFWLRAPVVGEVPAMKGV